VRWFRGQSIRARITIWSVLIGAVLIAAAAFAFRAGVDTIVSSSTRTLLGSDSAPYEASIRRGATTSFPPPAENQLVAVVDPSGKVAVSDLPDSLSDRVRSLVKLEHGLHVVRTSSTLEYYVSNEAVTVSGGTWHIVSARNRAAGAVVLQGLDVLMVAGSVALVVGLGIASWLVTGLALRPVTRMREQAKQLSRSATADTLPIGPVRDELSALADTLNTFITSVRASADRERQMVADASHELRTPIAVLTTQLQLAHLSRGDADALEREIDAAEHTLERLSTLTTNLLTLSRIEAADATDATAATPSEAIAVEFLSSMDRAIVLGSAHAVVVDFGTSGERADATVPILPADFAGLVDNLVSNAIAASSRGSAVDVGLAWERSRVVLTVEDSGHGIQDSFLPIAFDRFSRADTARSHPIGGNGLGLAIVKAIVTRSSGDVTLEQRPEGGVRATVTLPLL
jgi:two-component system OmpR family sensor kinase